MLTRGPDFGLLEDVVPEGRLGGPIVAEAALVGRAGFDAYDSGDRLAGGQAQGGTALEVAGGQEQVDVVAGIAGEGRPLMVAGKVIHRLPGGRGELRDGADIEAAINMLVGSYYAQYLAGSPFPKDWPEAAVDAILTGLARADA